MLDGVERNGDTAAMEWATMPRQVEESRKGMGKGSRAAAGAGKGSPDQPRRGRPG